MGFFPGGIVMLSRVEPNGYNVKHLAIIMDGNGRWATSRGLPRLLGHRAGAENLKRITEGCQRFGVEQLTVYAFSTENWKRPKEEVDGLMTLLIEFAEKELNYLNNKGVKINIIGDMEALPPKTYEATYKAMELTKDNSGMQINIALNYGGRKEILNAAKLLHRELVNGYIIEEDVNEELFKTFLYTGNIPDPDLVVRTSGEYRISNFLLWQIAYSELYFSDKYWPDFSLEDLELALKSYKGRNRRFGMINTIKAGD
jgi:undecaprenyl diphosphate synthase